MKIVVLSFDAKKLEALVKAAREFVASEIPRAPSQYAHSKSCFCLECKLMKAVDDLGPRK